MQVALEWSHLAASCLVAGLTAVLLYTTHRTLWFVRWNEKTGARHDRAIDRASIGVPDLSLEDLNTGDLVRLRDVEGQTTIFLFVVAHLSSSESYKHLHSAIHALLTKVATPIHVVCVGTGTECRALAFEHSIGGLPPSAVRVLVDHGERAFRAFGVTDTPEAITVDESLTITKYGLLMGEAEYITQTGRQPSARLPDAGRA